MGDTCHSTTITCYSEISSYSIIMCFICEYMFIFLINRLTVQCGTSSTRVASLIGIHVYYTYIYINTPIQILCKTCISSMSVQETVLLIPLGCAYFYINMHIL